MPLWLIQVLIQFPIVVVIGFVAWYAYGEIRRTSDLTLTYEREHREREIARLDRALTDVRADKDQQIARLEQGLADEIRGLGKKVESLVRKLN